jgi:hypothetical protein
MAKVTNAFASYSATANREDLSNAIYNIDPFDTPIMTMAGRRNVSQRTFDWQTEQLPAVNSTTADEEGYLLSQAAATPTVRLNNNTQINHRDATVTGSQEASDAAGKKSEMARQMAISSKALKRDVESFLCQNGPRVVGNDAGTARKTRALEHWISATAGTTGGTGYVNPASDTAAITDGTLRTLTETIFNDCLQTGYDLGAEPTKGVVRAAIKRKISAFTGRTGTQIKVDQNQAVNTVDLYKSDFGDISIIPTRWSRARTALILDPEYLAVAMFRSFHTWDAAKVGDAQTKVVQVEWGLECRNPTAHIKIADIQ